jgi:hypothetical protein
MPRETVNRAISGRGIGGTCTFIIVFVLIPGLYGCTYNAQLYEDGPFKPGMKVAVISRTTKKPVVKISESGDFLFWAAGGPGPIAASAAFVVNESNNRRHNEKLNSVLNKDCYLDRLTKQLRKALEERGLLVKEIKTEYKSIGDIMTMGLKGVVLDDGIDRQDLEYIMEVDTKYGLFDSEAQCGAQMEGQLIRVADDEVVWKNRLSFEGITGGRHKSFGDGKEAVKNWQQKLDALGVGIQKAIDGVCELLGREFNCRVKKPEDESLEKIKLKPGGNVKAQIIEQSSDRIVLRLEGGSVRSIPAEELVTEKRKDKEEEDEKEKGGEKREVALNK